MTTGTGAQLGALLALRWQMLRGRRARAAVPVGAAAVLGLLVLAAQAADTLTGPAQAAAVALAPQAFLGFGVLAVVAPLTAGGGGEVVPAEQLVAHPVRASTQFAGGLLLAPLNLVWVVQLLVLVTVTSVLAAGGSALRAGATTVAYVLALTVLGQVLAWTVVGARRTRAGRRAVVGVGVGALVLLVVVARTGGTGPLLALTPGPAVARAVAAGAGAPDGRWAGTTAVLLVTLAAGLVLGARACAWALRRPGDAGAGTATRTVRRRALRASPLRQLVALDRRSAWRAPALRRGGVVLALLPGVLVAGTELPWSSLIVVPGLIAAGAGLLFGVNAFALDGGGAVWVASLPVRPSLLLRAKAIVLTETVLGAAVVAALSVSVRSTALPTAAELAALACGGLACTAVVVQGCLAASVRRPHRADLGGPRDAVAPPGALAVASVRLAAPAALVGLVMQAAAGTGVVVLPVLLALPVLLGSALSVRHTLARWADPVARARVVQVVSAG